MIVFFLLAWSNKHELTSTSGQRAFYPALDTIRFLTLSGSKCAFFVQCTSFRTNQCSPSLTNCRLSCITVFQCLGPYKNRIIKMRQDKLPKNDIQSAQSKAY
jgi:hypothetical protein